MIIIIYFCFVCSAVGLRQPTSYCWEKNFGQIPLLKSITESDQSDSLTVSQTQTQSQTKEVKTKTGERIVHSASATVQLQAINERAPSLVTFIIINNNEDYLYSAKELNERHSWRFTYQLFLHTNTHTHARTHTHTSAKGWRFVLSANSNISERVELRLIVNGSMKPHCIIIILHNLSYKLVLFSALIFSWSVQRWLSAVYHDAET